MGVCMEKLIKFIKENYSTVTKKGITVAFLIIGEEYTTIALIKGKTINLMDKFIYQSSHGEYIRALTKPNHYVRVYLPWK